VTVFIVLIFKEFEIWQTTVYWINPNNFPYFSYSFSTQLPHFCLVIIKGKSIKINHSIKARRLPNLTFSSLA
jgi:hypothetical protein